MTGTDMMAETIMIIEVMRGIITRVIDHENPYLNKTDKDFLLMVRNNWR
ncbi:hypothetical protein [Pedobacter gandavensis]|nr:hypothetical protein [Pedobacter gandavensis]